MYNMSVSFENNLIQIQYNSHNIHIIDSYKIKRKRDMKHILSIVRHASLNRGIFYLRKENSWIREWKAHNILYKLGLFKSHTKDTDLDEKENKKRRFCYFILSLFSWG